MSPQLPPMPRPRPDFIRTFPPRVTITHSLLVSTGRRPFALGYHGLGCPVRGVCVWLGICRCECLCACVYCSINISGVVWVCVGGWGAGGVVGKTGMR